MKFRDPQTNFVTDMNDAQAKMLIASAGLTEQHRCGKCGVLLQAWGRDASGAWSCPPCNVEGATVAQIYEEGKSS